MGWGEGGEAAEVRWEEEAGEAAAVGTLRARQYGGGPGPDGAEGWPRPGEWVVQSLEGEGPAARWRAVTDGLASREAAMAAIRRMESLLRVVRLGAVD
jgi:hypothetical protein